MLDQIRTLLQTVSGVAEIPRQQAERLAKDLAKQSEAGAALVTGLAEDIVRRSRENAEMVRALVMNEVQRQVKALGLATNDEVERLSKRIRELERSRPSTAKPKPSDAKPRGAKPKA